MKEIDKKLEELRTRNQSDPVGGKLRSIEEVKNTELLKVFNGAYLAERFFGKSRSWFSQKLNHNIVNGQPAAFTEEEIETLKEGLYALSIEIEEIADNL